MSNAKTIRPNSIIEEYDIENMSRYIVRFKSPEARQDFLQEPLADHITILGQIPRLDAEVVEFPSEHAAEIWASVRDDIRYIEKDYKISTYGEKTPYGIEMVKALDVVGDYQVDSGISVCIIDSGYDKGHEDLPIGSIVSGDDNLCCILPNFGCACKWDDDTNGHGTHVAGTIAAIGGNDKGVKGVIRNGGIPLHITRVFGSSGSTTTSNIVNAMYKCEEAGANVVNMSLGGTEPASTTEDALEDILNMRDDILFIAAAGNEGDSSYGWPASFPNMMSVASVDEDSKRSSFSQFNDAVDITGPGSDVQSTVPRALYNNPYAYFSGTSMATPHVTGVAALIWSYHPTKKASDIREALELSATDLGPAGKDDKYGYGLVNAKAALNFLQDRSVPTLSPTTHSPTVSCIPITITINPDAYAKKETTWDLRGPDGNIMTGLSGGGDDFKAYEEFTVSTCLPEKCGSSELYNFNIYDSAGDGLNWYLTKPGYFQITTDDKDLSGSSDGTNFGYNDTVSIFACKTCVDSPLPARVDNKDRNCDWATKADRCSKGSMDTHCPNMCNTCDKYACTDSEATVVYNGSLRNCEMLKQLNEDQVIDICKTLEGNETCRKTCGFCDG